MERAPVNFKRTRIRMPGIRRKINEIRKEVGKKKYFDHINK